MRHGITLLTELPGTGRECSSRDTVVAHVTLSLAGSRDAPPLYDASIRVDLRTREQIAGIRYGLEGMRVGGKRELLIAPQLGYGANGLADKIPPNAELHCLLELLEIRTPGERRPEDYPPGKQLTVFYPGDTSSLQPRIQFGVYDDGRCGMNVTFPVAGLKWRDLRPKNVRANLSPERARQFIAEVECLITQHAERVLPAEAIYTVTDGSLFSRVGDERCLALTIYEQGAGHTWYIRESDPCWTGSAIAAHLEQLRAAKTAQ